ncbi:MAG: ATP-binding cassette domain-containing protein [Pseudomonadota bacterium]
MTISLEMVSVQHTGATIPALFEVTLRIEKGEQVALIGPSGAGKTTLLHTLALAKRPSHGTLRAFDTLPWEASNTRRHALRAQLFLAPQTPPLPPRQRVISAVLAGRLPYWGLWRALVSLIRPSETQRAFDALSRFSLEHKLYARVDRLSGGERQRCGMARLLVSDANLLLVDEPLSALDPTLALQTLNVIREEARSRDATLICSLHQVELARAHFARLIGLRDGRIVFDAPSAAVSESMIAELYRHADRHSIEPGPGSAQGPAVEPIVGAALEHPVVVAPRC